MSNIPSAKARQRIRLYYQDKKAERELEELDRDYFHKRFWPGDKVANQDGRKAVIVDRLVTYLCIDEEGTQVAWEEKDLRG